MKENKLVGCEKPCNYEYYYFDAYNWNLDLYKTDEVKNPSGIVLNLKTATRFVCKLKKSKFLF